MMLSRLSSFILVFLLLCGAAIAAEYEDTRVRFTAPYEITSSGWYAYSVETKQYDGPVNIVFGLDTGTVRPRAIQYYYDRSGYESSTYTCAPPNTYTYTNNPPTVTCYDENETLWWGETGWVSADLSAYSITMPGWRTEEYWKPLNGYWTRFRYEYDDKDTWYLFPNVPLIHDVPLRFRIWFDVPIIGEYKYDMAAWPSQYGLSLNVAYQNGALYLFDPFINSTDYEAGNLTNATNTWLSDMNVSSTVELDPGADTFTLGTTAGSPAIIEADAVVYYAFDDDRTDSGPLGLDIVTSANYNFTTTAQAVVGNATTNYSSLGYHTIPAAVADLLGGNPDSFVIALWEYPDAAGGGNDYSMRFTDHINFWTYYDHNTEDFKFQYQDVTDAYRNCDLLIGNDDTWANRVFYYNGSDVRHYINGDSGTACGYAPKLNTVATSTTLLGRDPGNAANWVGRIDEWFLAINITTWNQSKVDEIYGGGSGATYDELFGSVPGAYNISADTYLSDTLSIGINATNYTINLTYEENGGNVTLNITCDADAVGGGNWTVVTDSSNHACPTRGDVFQYRVTLDGSSVSSPVVQNITARFSDETPPPGAPQWNFSVSARNNVTNASISTFNVTVNGTAYSTTNGTVVTGIYNNTGVVNVSLNATGYYGRVYAGVNTSTNHTAYLEPLPSTPTAALAEDAQTTLLIFLVVLLLVLCGIAFVTRNFFFGVLAVLVWAFLFFLITRGTFTEYADVRTWLITFHVVVLGGASLGALLRGLEGSE